MAAKGAPRITMCERRSPVGAVSGREGPAAVHPTHRATHSRPMTAPTKGPQLRGTQVMSVFAGSSRPMACNLA